MRKIIYISILILFTHAVEGQSYVGFKGKTNVFGFNYGFGLGYVEQHKLVPTPVYIPFEGTVYGSYIPNHRFEFFYEKVKTKKLSVGVSLKFITGYCDANHMNYLAGVNLNSSPLNTFYLPDQLVTGGGKTAKIQLGVFGKRYLKRFGGFAPNGIYIDYGVNANFVTLSNSAVFYSKPLSLTSKDSLVKDLKGTQYLSFRLGFGRTNIIKFKDKHIVLNMAIASDFGTYLLVNSGVTHLNAYKKYLQVYHKNLDAFCLKVGAAYVF
jgi:hypothetical protein